MTTPNPPPTKGFPPKKLLEAHHRFPGPYTFKIILPAAEDIESMILATVNPALTEPDRARTTKRSSTSGRHDSVTVVIHASSADEVLAVYALLATIPDVKALF